jgi:TetR/AcrR family transcriptional repressor of nem operon
MGHSRAAKADTHERIVNIASRRLREQGLDGVGVAEVMQEAGLTVGGFYKHFDSRDDLIREALAAACGAWQARAAAAKTGGPPLTYESLVADYLSLRHRDNPGAGCPVSAVAADVARADPETRAVLAERLEQNLTLLASLVRDEGPLAARATAILTYAALIGAINMARIATDEALAREILETVAAMLARD